MLKASDDEDLVEGLVKLAEQKKSTDEINKYLKQAPSLKKPYQDFLDL